MAREGANATAPRSDRASPTIEAAAVVTPRWKPGGITPTMVWTSSSAIVGR